MHTVQEVGPRGPLTRKAICETALQIIDAEGLEAVSMRSLASALGVKAGSLYHHFRNKEDILTEAAELLYQEARPLPCDGDWKEQVSAIFLQLANLLEMHPQAAPLLIGNLARSRGAQERARALVVAVRASGLEPELRESLLGNLAALLAGHSVISVWVSDDLNTAARGDSQVDQPLPAVETRVRPMGVEFEAGMNALIEGFLERARGTRPQRSSVVV